MFESSDSLTHERSFFDGVYILLNAVQHNLPKYRLLVWLEELHIVINGFGLSEVYQLQHGEETFHW